MVIGSISIFIGALVAGTLQPFQKVVLACISGALIAGAGNSINDFYDVEIDKINKKNRPIPCGNLSRNEALLFSLMLFGSGVAVSIRINAIAFSVALSSSLLLVLYSAYLKRTVVFGNLTVSFISGLAFIYGGVAVGRFFAALIPAGFAFMFHWAREIIKDMEDMEGDKTNNAITLPVKHGKKPALVLASSIFLILILTTFCPYVFRVYGLVYLICVIVGVDTVIAYVIVSMWKNSNPTNLGRLSTLLKIDMLAGLVAIYTGRYF